MNNLPGSSTSYPVNIRAPSGDENRNTTVIDRGFQDCADRTAYLYERIPGLAAVTTFAPSLINAYSAADPGVWARSISSDVYWATQTVSDNDLLLDITPWIPQVCTLTAFGASVYPGTGRSAMPAMPAIKLLRRGWNALPNAAWDELALVSDSATTLETYETAHTFGGSAFTFAINKTSAYKYALALRPESGPNAQSGLFALTMYFQVGT